MIITILIYVAIIHEFGVLIWYCSAAEIDSVFLTPFGVTSNIQERIMTIGKLITRAAITIAGIFSGKFKGMTTLLTSSIIINEEEA